MPYFIAVLAIGILGSGGYFVDKAGEGINDAGTGVAKLAVIGLGGFYVLKKMKVIK